jgi:hypothetical protein
VSLPLLMVRSGHVLRPADDLAAEDMTALKEGKRLLVTVTHARSLQQHRLFFAMLRKVAQSTPTPLSEAALLSWVKVKTGHVETLPLGFGQVYQAPASIAWDKMDQREFRQFFDRAVELILTDICPALPASFADEFLAMLEAPSSSTAKAPASPIKAREGAVA